MNHPIGKNASGKGLALLLPNGGDGRGYFFLAIATVIKPKIPIPIAGPIVLSDKKVHTAKAMQSSPTIRRSFLIFLATSSYLK